MKEIKAISLYLFVVLFMAGCNITRHVNKDNRSTTSTDNSRRVITEQIHRIANKNIVIPEDTFDYSIGIQNDDGKLSLGNVQTLNLADDVSVSFEIKGNNIVVHGVKKEKLVPVKVDETVNRVTNEALDKKTTTDESNKVKDSKTSWTAFHIIGGIVSVAVVFIVVFFAYRYLKSRSIL